MPELPEVEVLVRHLAPLLKGKTIRAINVRRTAVLAPTTVAEFMGTLLGGKFTGLTRRGKYLMFTLRAAGTGDPFLLVGHLGMTGRIYLQRKSAPLPKHAAVAMELGAARFVYEDPRYFGRLTLDTRGPAKLGPEPFAPEFTVSYLAGALGRSAQAIKVRLLDQTLVAGVGNIYASEALFRAGISPRLAARKLRPAQIAALRRAIRGVLALAIRRGSTLPLDFSGGPRGDRLFYHGSAPVADGLAREMLRVYDRAGLPCPTCGAAIRRLVQAARSTFYCPACQCR